MLYNAQVLRLVLSIMPLSIDLHVKAPFTKSEIKRKHPFFSRKIFTLYLGSK